MTLADVEDVHERLAVATCPVAARLRLPARARHVRLPQARHRAVRAGPRRLPRHRLRPARCVIGDADSDIEAGAADRCRTIRVGPPPLPSLLDAARDGRLAAGRRNGDLIANPPGYGGPDYDDHICSELAALGGGRRAGHLPLPVRGRCREPAGYRRSRARSTRSARGCSGARALRDAGQDGRAPARHGPARAAAARTSPRAVDDDPRDRPLAAAQPRADGLHRPRHERPPHRPEARARGWRSTAASRGWSPTASRASGAGRVRACPSTSCA